MNFKLHKRSDTFKTILAFETSVIMINYVDMLSQYNYNLEIAFTLIVRVHTLQKKPLCVDNMALLIHHLSCLHDRHSSLNFQLLWLVRRIVMYTPGLRYSKCISFYTTTHSGVNGIVY